MSAERSGEDTKYVCDTCHRIFQFRTPYLKHMQVHKETLFHQCFECALGFTSDIQYFDHLKFHIQDSTLKCLYCSEFFSSPDIRRLHENNHFIGNRFICEICNRKFATEMPLEQHLPLHGPKNLLILECHTARRIKWLKHKMAEEIST
ncbi:hypothetical protein TNIN_12651 [Trichonephila inaurata madagascariensis]|uniref:C2H2-type domain-containing protein n=1 Tax=Trichonephila inaurata madagascariensis TaxID=2747483 RepID=A0A8X7CR34_9ARAC|nr:hypothetical protein TNIN_12651 [Trichonephila inaurata madagascariensis]